MSGNGAYRTLRRSPLVRAIPPIERLIVFGQLVQPDTAAMSDRAVAGELGVNAVRRGGGTVIRRMAPRPSPRKPFIAASDATRCFSYARVPVTMITGAVTLVRAPS